MFRTITSHSSEASSHKLYNALVCSCRRVEEHTNALYSLWDDAPDDGLVIVRNMQSQIIIIKIIYKKCCISLVYLHIEISTTSAVLDFIFSFIKFFKFIKVPKHLKFWTTSNTSPSTTRSCSNFVLILCHRNIRSHIKTRQAIKLSHMSNIINVRRTVIFVS